MFLSKIKKKKINKINTPVLSTTAGPKITSELNYKTVLVVEPRAVGTFGTDSTLVRPNDGSDAQILATAADMLTSHCSQATQLGSTTNERRFISFNICKSVFFFLTELCLYLHCEENILRRSLEEHIFFPRILGLVTVGLLNRTSFR